MMNAEDQVQAMMKRLEVVAQLVSWQQDVILQLFNCTYIKTDGPIDVKKCSEKQAELDKRADAIEAARKALK